MVIYMSGTKFYWRVVPSFDLFKLDNFTFMIMWVVLNGYQAIIYLTFNRYVNVCTDFDFQTTTKVFSLLSNPLHI